MVGFDLAVSTWALSTCAGFVAEMGSIVVQELIVQDTYVPDPTPPAPTTVNATITQSFTPAIASGGNNRIGNKVNLFC
jgi:hypothetical protein